MKHITLLMFDCKRITNNNRIYPKDVVEKSLNDLTFKDRLINKLFYLYSSEDNGDLNLKNVIGVLDDYFWEDFKCYGNFTVFDDNTSVRYCNTVGIGLMDYSSKYDLEIATKFTFEGVIATKEEENE